MNVSGLQYLAVDLDGTTGFLPIAEAPGKLLDFRGYCEPMDAHAYTCAGCESRFYVPVGEAISIVTTEAQGVFAARCERCAEVR